ncbi:MAG: N-acetylglucosamine-6-phosphate deacetylase [Clostridia bacterium]|nr:N-acetylglucosamine-6-phosphate deacetylase [Clostridia bacterium]
MTRFKNALINGTLMDFGVEKGKFAYLEPSGFAPDGEDLEGREVIPGLIDIHTHGCMGLDTMDGVEAIVKMSGYYAQNAVTCFYPTTMSDYKDSLVELTAALPETTGAVPLGYHLEGPFIALSHKGAQAEGPIRAADLAHLALYNNIGLITLAPEFPGAMEAIRKSPVPVSLGHTGCDYDLAMEAFEKGAVCVTHMCNAMPPIHHRQPSLMGAALMSNAYIQVICDLLHLHPAMVLLLYRAFGPHRMILISDSMRATGLPDGTYDLGGQEVTVQEGVSRLPDGTIAGSTANLLYCVKQAISIGIPKEDAVKMASQTPADMMGLNKGELAVGKDADFAVMDEAFTPVAVYYKGTKRSFFNEK